MAQGVEQDELRGGEDVEGAKLARPKGLDYQPGKPLTDEEKAKLNETQKSLDAGETAEDPNGGNSSPLGGRGGSGGGGGIAGRLGGIAKGLGSFTGKHKRSMAALGGGGSVIVLLILGFTALLPLKLFDMEKNLFNHNFRVEENTEQKVTSKLLTKLSPYDEAGRNKIKGKGFFGNKWANFRVDRFDTQLAEKGVKLTIDPQTHQIASIERNGVKQTFTEQDGTLVRAKAVISVVTDEIPPWRIAKRLTFIKLMTIRYGVSFRFWRKEKIANVTDYLKERANEIRNGATSDEITTAEQLGQDSKPVDPTKPTDFNTANQKGDALTQQVKDTFTKTGSIKAAIQSGVDAVKGNKAIGFVGMAALVCQIKAIADESVQKGYAVRAEELMRQGGSLLAAASQLRNGENVDPQSLNYLMNQYAGDSSAKPIVVKNQSAPNENSLDFTQSAAWHRANGQPVSAANPELNGSANPNAKNGEADVISVIDAISTATGGSALCAITTGFVGLLASAVEVGANLFDAGAEEIATTVAKFAVQAVLVAQVVPKILAGAAGLAITGTENAVQLISFDDSGMGLMANDYARSFGAAPISDTSYGSLADEANNSAIAQAQGKGLAYSLFSTDYTGSLVSKLALNAPSSPGQAVTSFASLFMNLPSFFKTHLLAIIAPAQAAGINDNPGQFQRYGFTDAELNTYEISDTYSAYDKYGDPTPSATVLKQGLANYFENPIATVNGQPVSRLDVMGNPDDYPYGSEDSNNNDALHCFVNSFTNPEVGTVDPICLNIGYLTQNSGQPNATEADFQKAIQKNVYDAYCQANLAGQQCPFVAASDEMLRYRLYLAYEHIASQLYATTVDTNASGQ